MKFQSYRGIVAWQKAKSLSVQIYKLFSKNPDFRFRDQISSASISVCSNIAEGYGRNSKNEFIRFLDIAKGSLYEVNSLLDIARELQYIKEDAYQQLDLSCNEITKIIYGLIKKLKAQA
jgi:four helix bundle protein